MQESYISVDMNDIDEEAAVIISENAYIHELNNGSAIIKDAPAAMYTDQFDYNCGGFALGNFDWYVPESYEDLSRYEDDFDSPEYADICNKLAEQYIKDMLYDKTISVRHIHSEDELQKDERLVAFRASADDFHYMRKLSNGKWAHKRGSSRIEDISEDEVFSSYGWYGKYQGEVQLLAVS